ncbi:hypothetical protein ACOSQ2_003760 [Xanthoceras sorbifolium]
MANDEVPSTPPSNSGKTAASSGSSKPEFSSNSSKSDISNPYFTHHSDHPGLVLVSKSLNGDNYAGWKRAMTLALNSKNKLGFVNRSIEAPSKEADPEGYATWSRCNDMVHSWIVNTLNPEIADSMIYYSTTHEVWEDLCERFSQSNALRIFEIQRDIAYLRQEQLSVSAYYTKLKGLWDELASYSDTTHGAQADQQKLMQFLMGLNETYSAIRGQILLMNPLPSIRQAYSSVSQEEKQRLLSTIQTATELSSAAIAVRHNNYGGKSNFSAGTDRSYQSPANRSSQPQNVCSEGERRFNQDRCRFGSGKGRPQCTHYGEISPWVQKCFQLHGYPSGHLKARMNSGPNSNQHKGFSAANQVSEVSHNAEVRPTVSLSETQLKQLLSLLNNQDEGLSKIDFRNWIIDSGATDHITSSSKLLYKDKNCSLPPVLLPTSPTIFDHSLPSLEPSLFSPEPSAPPPEPLRHSSRQMASPVKLNDYVCSNVYFDQSTSFVPGPTKGTRYPLTNYASRQWFAKFSEAIRSAGYEQTKADFSLFIRKQRKSFTALLIYVDDILITGNDPMSITDIKKFLHNKFRLKDLGKLKYFLGIEISASRNGIFISQRKYALEIIKDAGLLGATPINTPMECGLKLSDKSEILKDPGRYRRLVGRLIYLTVLRPDITYAVHILSRFMHQPRKDHWEAALRVVCYLKSAPGQGLFFSSTSDLWLRAYFDSDWAGCPLTRRSTIGYCVFLGPSLISWRSKRQKTVSLSSAEAEYRAMTGACCELTWLRYLLRDLGVLQQEAALLYCDNKATIHIAANPIFHERTRHIKMDCHFIRNKIQDGFVVTRFVSSANQLADVLTKALRKEFFIPMVRKLGVQDIHSPT